jgi:hypothetical protein
MEDRWRDALRRMLPVRTLSTLRPACCRQYRHAELAASTEHAASGVAGAPYVWLSHHRPINPVPRICGEFEEECEGEPSALGRAGLDCRRATFYRRAHNYDQSLGDPHPNVQTHHFCHRM